MTLVNTTRGQDGGYKNHMIISRTCAHPRLLRPVEMSVIFTVYPLRLVHEFVIQIHKVFIHVERP